MVKTRVLVALVGVPLGLVAVIVGGYVFFGLVAVLTLLGLHEYYTLVRPYKPNLLVGYLGAAGAVAGAYFLGLEGFVGGFFSVVLFLLLWGIGASRREHLVGRLAITSFGVLWVAAGFSHLLLLRGSENGLALVLLVVGCTWSSDTLAFFMGRAFGRRKMAPRVSPGKTMEGAFAGLLGSVLFALIVKIYSPWLAVEMAALLGLIIGLAGQWGDLFESAVKRDLRVKDSGRVFPGHGGVLDRFDSLLFAGIVAYWASFWLLGDVVGTVSG